MKETYSHEGVYSHGGRYIVIRGVYSHERYIVMRETYSHEGGIIY